MGHIIHLTDIEKFKAGGKVRKLRKAVRYRSQRDLVPDWKVCAAAADALACLGDAGAVEPLICALEDDRSEVREASARALGRLTARDAVEPLIRAVGDSDWRVRDAAARALGQLGDRAAVEPLRLALGDDSLWVGKDAAEALGLLGDARATDPLVAAVRDDRRPFVRAAAASALGQLGDPSGLACLVTALRDHNCDVRWAAATALDRLGWRPDRAAAAATYWTALRKWDKCAEVSAIEPLIAVLDDEQAHVRRGAACALGCIGNSEASDPLVELLTDRDRSVRAAAAEALDGLGWRPAGENAEAAYFVAKEQWAKCVTSAAVEPLLVSFQSDSRAYSQLRIADVLGRIGDARAIDPLVAALDYACHAAQDWDEVFVGQHAAAALVALYGRLDAEAKARILTQRDLITFDDDVPDREGVPVRVDRSTGVDFGV